MLKLSIKLYKSILLIIASILCCAILLIFYFDHKGFFANSHERFFYKKLSAASKNNQDYLLLKDATNFEWYYVCIITPYSSSEEYQKAYYEKIVGFEFDGKIPNLMAGGENDIYLLFITKRKKSLMIEGSALVEEKPYKASKVCNKLGNKKFTLDRSDLYRRGLYKFGHKFILDDIN